jgi:hypothetical protein
MDKPHGSIMSSETPNQFEPTASRRTTQVYMTSTHPSAAMHALARGGSSWSR